MSLPCDLRVSPLKTTRPQRSVCGLPGKFFSVTGGVGGLVLIACRYHRRSLEKLGLEVRELTPLEATALIKLRLEDHQLIHQHDGSAIDRDSCTCGKDPFTCPVNDHAVKARSREIQ